MATCVAASSGLSPVAVPAHCARGAVRHSACSTGTSSAAIAPTSHASSSPPAWDSAGATPPAASTVTTSASACRSTPSSPSSADRRLAHHTGSGVAPAAQTARHRSSMNAVLPGQLMRPVVDDAHDRPRRLRRHLRRRPVPHPPGRGRGRRGEAGPAQQHRVVQEAGQLQQVAGAAVGQVLVGLGRDAGRHRGQCHQGGIGGQFAAEHHHRAAVGAQPGQPLAPGLLAAEQPHHHDVRAVDQGGQLVEGQPGRVGQPVGRAAGPRGQQVGV